MHCPAQELFAADPAALGAGLALHLKSLRQRDPSQLASGDSFVGDNIVHPTAKIGQHCKIGPNVSIGIGCEIANGVRISDSVLLHRVKVRMGFRRRGGAAPSAVAAAHLHMKFVAAMHGVGSGMQSRCVGSNLEHLCSPS